MYRIVVQWAILDDLSGAIQSNRSEPNQTQMTTNLTVNDANNQEAFRPNGMRARLDQHSGPVREGMRITFELLKRMDEMCRQNGAQMVVVVIPTKETVFADYLLRGQQVHLHDVIERLVANERDARKQLF